MMLAKELLPGLILFASLFLIILALASCKKENVNKNPTEPTSPVPGLNAINISTSPTLSWDCTDPEGDPMTYDVYFGTDAPPTIIFSSVQSERIFKLAGLIHSKDYYWKIVAKDSKGNTSEGPVWKFTTIAANKPPAQPVNPLPGNNTVEISLTPSLSWDCTDPDGDPLTFDIYLGAAAIPTIIVSSNLIANKFDPTGLSNGQDYYWKIVAKDSHANATNGPIWKFSTLGSSGSAPVADFIAAPTFISRGKNVQFTDKSTNYPTEWLWNFGDGSTSSLQNPSHTYSETGLYTVSLTASNSIGKNTKTSHSNYVMVAEADFETGAVTDIEGNVYNTLKIGDQWWMAENLRTTAYNDGTSIPLVTSNSEWAALTTSNTAGYCWSENDITNKAIYGALYNWIPVNSGKLAPAGWHIPTDAEWKQLEKTLGMTQQQADETNYRGTDQGASLKYTSGWSNYGNGANTSGFTALPGGARDPNGLFYPLGESGYWWSASEFSQTDAWSRVLSCWRNTITRIGFPKAGGGCSVRCVKNQ